MQPSCLESSDGIEQMERLGSPSLSWGSSGFNDGSDSPRIYPRIGDNYQAKVSPFKSEGNFCLLGMNDSMHKNDNWDEGNEQLLTEELSVPVMQIPCFLPRFDVKDCQTNHKNQPSPDIVLSTMEPSSTVPNKKDDGLFREDLFEFADKGHNHELNIIDTTQFTEDNLNSSITDLKTDFSRVDGACTDTIMATDNIPESRGHNRKRGRAGWKRVKKMKFELLKQSSHFNWQMQHTELFNAREDTSSKDFIVVPGSPSAPWSEIEEDAFILGLYIFGKNLTAVKRFVETKAMGDILSYYYGKFFRTEAYCRWAESRNTRSRKCVQGQRIFSAWRQQELLTRLLPHIPEHLKHEVPKVTKAFNEGAISMEEFVMKIRALAGLDTFVQAVGIGKGKQDLTAAIVEPTKTNQVTARSEIPMGSACSALSTEEIVKFLTGDFRLSKARANDLFWEAVWPRLLARGWNSEQPEDQGLSGFKQSLVFLIPGIKKFSRRKLIKGIHYFDSVSEVLSRVASDPRLLEVEMDEVTGNRVKPECLWATEVTEEQNGHPGHPHCYLHPRFPTNYFDSFIFTVVDTSLSSQGVEPVRIRENRTLPADDDSDMLQSESGETDKEDNLGSQLDGQDNVCNHSAVGDSLNDDAEESSDIVTTNKNLGENGITGICKASSHDQWDYPCSPLKQRRLSICNYHQGSMLDFSLIGSSDSKDQEVMLKNGPKKDNPEEFLDASPLEVSISIPPSVEASPEKRNRAIILSRGCFSANRINNNSHNSGPCTLTPETGLSLSLPPEKPDHAMLNCIPAACSEFLEARKSEEHSQSVENSYSEEVSGHPQEHPNDSGMAQSSIPSPDESQCPGILENNLDPLPENVRRQSTRNRPLTARVLEAFACGFFTTRRQRKAVKKTSNPESSHTKSISRLVQDDLARSHNTCSSDSNDINTVDTSMESMHGDSNTDSRLGSKSRLVSKRKR